MGKVMEKIYGNELGKCFTYFLVDERFNSNENLVMKVDDLVQFDFNLTQPVPSALLLIHDSLTRISQRIIPHEIKTENEYYYK